jgi:anti-sigma regulatory factor (Ser/Thr protein kinase)
MIELVDASAAEARRVLVLVGRGHVADTILNELLIGVSEAVGNALTHGRAPVIVRIWVTPDRLVISVHDQGRGPADPLAGHLPDTASEGSRRRVAEYRQRRADTGRDIHRRGHRP